MTDVPALPEGASYTSQNQEVPALPKDATYVGTPTSGADAPIGGFTKDYLLETFPSLPFEPTDDNINKLNQQYMDFLTTGKSINIGTGGYLGLVPNSSKLYDTMRGIDPNIDYDSGTNGTGFSRAALSQADTLEEKLKLINDHFGEGSAGQDSFGRLTFKDPNTNQVKTIDSLNFELEDFSDLADDLPMVATTLGTAWATGGTSLGYQLLADSAAYVTGRMFSEGIENLRGANLESVEEQADRLKSEAFFAVPATFAIGGTMAAFSNRMTNPLYPTLTPKSLQVIEDQTRMNARRVERGEEPVTLLASALNEAPFLARAEGILSKLPLSSWIYKQRQDTIDNAINDEVTLLTEKLPTTIEGRTEAASSIKAQLKRIVDEEADMLFSTNNARFTGKSPYDGAETMTDGVKVAAEKFKLDASKRGSSLAAVVGEAKFIPVGANSGFKRYARAELKKLPLDKDGRVVAAFRPLEARLKSWLKMEDTLSFSQWSSIRQDLGKVINKDGDAIITNIDSGRAKQMYKEITKAMDRALFNPKKTASLLPKGVGEKKFKKWFQELKDYNDWYSKNHELFVDKKGALSEIAKSSSAWDLVDYFLRKNNSVNIKEIKKHITPEKFKESKEAVKNILLFERNGKKRSPREMEKMINGLGEETVDAWLGTGWYKTIGDLSTGLKSIQDLPINKLISEKTDAGKFFNNLLKNKNAESVIGVRKKLGKDSEEWKQMQTFYMSALLERSIKDGALNGKALLKNLRSIKTGKGKQFGDTQGFNKFMFDGTGYYNVLEDLGELAVAAQKSKTSLAGGLAAGMMQMSFMTGNIVSTGGLAAVTWLMAKALTSKTASKWLTNKPLQDVTRAEIRAFTETLLRVSEETSDESPLKQRADKELNKVINSLSNMNIK